MAGQGSVVLVAGGTGGLGRAVSRAFLDAGATVVVSYRTPQEFADLRAAAAVHETRLQGERLDVTDEAAVRQVVERIATQHGRLDALVNAVGGYAGGEPLWNVEGAVLDRMLALNLRPNHVLIWEAMRRATHAGVTFDLGRAAPEQEGLVEFKTRWGGEPVPLAYDYWPEASGLNTAKRDSGALGLAGRVWSRLPEAVARRGSFLYRYLG